MPAPRGASMRKQASISDAPCATFRRLMLRALAVAIVCSGCAQVLGLDETSSIGSLAVRLQRASVGTTVEFNPLDVGTTLPSFVVLDTAEPSGVRLVAAGAAQPGRWVAPTNAVEGVIYSYPESPIPHLLSFPKFAGSDLRTYVRAYEHPNPQPAPSPPPDVMISVSLPTAYQATERFMIEVVGAWVQYAVPPPALGNTVLTAATSYAAFTPTDRIGGGSVGQITAQDVVGLLRYEAVAGGSKLTGQLSFNPPDQTSEPMTVSGPLIPIAASQYQTLGATVPAAAVAARFAAQMPAVPPPAQGWRVEAAPGYAIGLPVGMLLADGPIAPDATTIAATYANPFSAQWHPTINYIASSQRTYSSGTASTMMSTSLQAIAEATASLTLDAAAGLPTMMAVNGMPLNVDGISLSLNVDGPIYVDITADRTQNTLYQVTVVELATAGTQFTRTPVAVVSGIESRLPLPPRVLQRGHTYFFQVTTTAGGYTKAPSGDLQTFALPVSHGSQDSAVFIVAP